MPCPMMRYLFASLNLATRPSRPSRPARHGKYDIDMPPLLSPTTVPVALQRAADVASIYGFSTILIQVENDELWRSEWGQVVTT